MEPYKIYDFEDEKAWLKGRLNGIGVEVMQVP